MRESEMDKIDEIIDPMIAQILSIMEKIEKKLPCCGSSFYKKSPIRSIKTALNYIKKASYSIDKIEVVDG